MPMMGTSVDVNLAILLTPFKITRAEIKPIVIVIIQGLIFMVVLITLTMVLD